MSELKIRDVDDWVIAALETRAKHRGVSLEDEARATLTATVQRRREALFARAAALRQRTRPTPPHLDSARIIREERDAWG